MPGKVCCLGIVDADAVGLLVDVGVLLWTTHEAIGRPLLKLRCRFEALQVGPLVPFISIHSIVLCLQRDLLGIA